MAFQNPLFSDSGNLIVTAIQSPDFVAGISGWQIRKDGSSEFNNVDARGIVEVDGPDGSHVKLTTDPDTAIVEMQPPTETGADYGPGKLTTASFLDGTAYTMLESPYDQNVGTDQAIIQLEGSDTLSPTSAVFIVADGTFIVGNLQVEGVISPFGGIDSIAAGQTVITPSGVNVPTSKSITGLNVNAVLPIGFATANTTVIGSETTQVKGVAVSSVTTSSLLVWVSRGNTTDTTVNYMVTEGA